MKQRPLEERFWEKVDKNGPVPAHKPELGPCWLWLAFKNLQGYGLIRVGRTMQLVSRTSLRLAGQIVPDELCALHHCDNTSCVRPDHIFLDTRLENNRDRDQKGRQAKGERHGSTTHPESVARGNRHGFRIHPGAAARGENAGKAKLADRDVIYIRTCHKGGATQSALAREFGLSSRNVCAIVRGESWKHLPL
jgi:hypothetical protein